MILRSPCKGCLVRVSCSSICPKFKCYNNSLKEIKSICEDIFVVIYFSIMILAIVFAFISKWRS